MNTVEMKVSELEGVTLDWTVAEAIGAKPFIHKHSAQVLDGTKNIFLPKFSSDWAYGGPLIEENKVDLFYSATAKGPYNAGIYGHKKYASNSYLVSAMRAIVYSIMGDTVEVPEELIK